MPAQSAPAGGPPVVLEAMGLLVHVWLGGSREPELRAEVEKAWSRCLVAEQRSGPSGADAAPAVEVQALLDEDLEVVAGARARGAVAGSDLVPVMDELSTRVTQACLEQKVGGAWLLHACALADPDSGATVVLVAASGTGKTTAALTLGRELGYLSDETAVIGLDGSVEPFAKPLSLLVDGRRPKRQVSPADVGLLPPPEKAHLVAVALLRRDPEVDGVRVEPVPTVEALPLLAEQTSSLHLLDRPLHTVAGLLDARGGARRLVYAEAADLLPVVREWLDASPEGGSR